MAVFNIASPDQNLPEAINVKMRSFNFGDGYSQEVADGINNTSSEFQVNFSSRPQSTIQAIDDFLRAQAGSAFSWTTPRGILIKVKCKTWSPNYMVSTSCSLSATFTQSFEP